MMRRGVRTSPLLAMRCRVLGEAWVRCLTWPLGSRRDRQYCILGIQSLRGFPRTHVVQCKARAIPLVFPVFSRCERHATPSRRSTRPRRRTWRASARSRRRRALSYEPRRSTVAGKSDPPIQPFQTEQSSGRILFSSPQLMAVETRCCTDE